jgi:hypothetical protein
MDNKEEVLHYVRLDEHLSLEWKIPKVLTLDEFREMAEKLNRMFNLILSEIPQERKELVETAEKEADSVLKTERHRPHHYQRKWSIQLIEKLKELYNSGKRGSEISQQLQKETGDSYFDPWVIHSKIGYMRQTGQLRKNGRKAGRPKKTEKKIRHKTFFPEQHVKDMKEMIMIGLSDKTIRDNLNKRYDTNYTHLQIGNKVRNIKKEKPSFWKPFLQTD